MMPFACLQLKILCVFCQQAVCGNNWKQLCTIWCSKLNAFCKDFSDRNLRKCPRAVWSDCGHYHDGSSNMAVQNCMSCRLFSNLLALSYCTWLVLPWNFFLVKRFASLMELQNNISVPVHWCCARRDALVLYIKLENSFVSCDLLSEWMCHLLSKAFDCHQDGLFEAFKMSKLIVVSAS